MVLGGIVVFSFFQALLSILKTMADMDNVLPSITFWLMGSLGRGSNHDVLVLLPFLAVFLLLLFLFRYSINALSIVTSYIPTTIESENRLIPTRTQTPAE